MAHLQFVHGIRQLLYGSLRDAGLLDLWVVLELVGGSGQGGDDEHEGRVRAATERGDVLVLVAAEHARACYVVYDHTSLADCQLHWTLRPATSSVLLEEMGNN